MKTGMGNVNFDETLFVNRLLAFKAAGLVPGRNQLDGARESAYETLISRATGVEEGWLNRATLIFLAHYKPWAVTRNRKFNTQHYKTLESIKELWTKRPEYQTGKMISLFKSHRFMKQLLQMYDVPLKGERLGEAFQGALLKYSIPGEFEFSEYAKFRQESADEFMRLHDESPVADLRLPREHRNFEAAQTSKNRSLFTLFCYEQAVFRGMIDRRIVLETYRRSRKYLKELALRRAWLLAFLPLQSFAYQLPLFNPITTSFFLSDDDITKLVIRVLIFKGNRESARTLEKIWRAFLKLYPVYIYLLDLECAEGKRGSGGRRIKRTKAQCDMEIGFSLYGLTWKTAKALADKGEDIPLAHQLIEDEHSRAMRQPEELKMHELLTELGEMLKTKAGLTVIEAERFLDLTLRGPRRLWDAEAEEAADDGISVSGLAAREGVSRQAIISSLRSCEKKIKAATGDGKLSGRDIVHIIKGCTPTDWQKRGDLTLGHEYEDDSHRELGEILAIAHTLLHYNYWGEIKKDE